MHYYLPDSCNPVCHQQRWWMWLPNEQLRFKITQCLLSDLGQHFVRALHRLFHIVFCCNLWEREALYPQAIHSFTQIEVQVEEEMLRRKQRKLKKLQIKLDTCSMTSSRKKVFSSYTIKFPDTWFMSKELISTHHKFLLKSRKNPS